MSWTAVDAYVTRVAERARAGAPAAAGGLSDLPAEAAPLAAVLVRAERRGRALLPGLTALARERRRAGRLVDAGQRFLRLAQGRAALALGFAVTVRLGLGAPTGELAADRGACGAAVVLVLLGQTWLWRARPAPWLGRRAPDPLALAWVGDYLNADAPSGRPWSEAVRCLALRQLRAGVALEFEIRRTLADWARARAAESRERLVMLGDAWPLLELATVGVPAALLLLIPALAALGS